VGQHPRELPIFELPLAILPTEQLPLHIFEERYKRMIAHCLQSSSPFGIVLRTDSGVSTTGCAAVVTDVLDEFEDGRLNILVAGEWRFRIDDRLDEDEYPRAAVTPLPEEPDAEADPEPARRAFRELLETIGSEPSSDPDLGSAFEIAGRIELPTEVKQQLLDAGSEPARLEILTGSLRRLAEEVRRTRKLAELASSNGHGRIEDMRSE
jgi:Lon protease-like protein